MDKLHKTLKLLDNHPTMEKITQVCELADKLGIRFSFYAGTVVVEDDALGEDHPTLCLEDIEQGHVMEQFPFATEYKVTYENPKYTEMKELEWKEQREKENAAKEAKALKAKEQAAAEKLLQQKEKENRELRQLAELKAKYENNS